ncbi:MAG TPA: sigma-54 dependent transcriptional regulator [Nannocystaceae bacterium]|nr:sigma-54 dependent transcriptional regulator [Nannocystaceae bacterium]
MKATILVVDDDPAMRDLLATELRRGGYDSVLASDRDEALARLAERRIDVVVTDLRMPGASGNDLCREIVQSHPTIPVIVMTGFGSMEAAVESIRAGAYDFLTKPFPFEKLKVALERALEHAAMHAEIRRLRRKTADAPGLAGILGATPAMDRVFELIERIAPTEASVLLTGESGTGKERVARALHDLSRRSAGPFVAINCAAVPESVFESELFGHVRGAFTGAERDRAGLIRQAHRGTLFLDEIGELPAALQPKLLRVLQEGRVRPVGADAEVRIDTRFVTATNRDLTREIADGKFRADLYYRLAVITIQLPPLRERGDDILLLADHFVDEIADAAGIARPEIGDDATERLLTYAWPGNVRELRNWMEHAVAMADGPVIRARHLPHSSAPLAPLPRPAALDEVPADLETLDEIDRRHILKVLAAVRGNKSQAAKILGIDRKTLLARLQRYGAQ